MGGLTGGNPLSGIPIVGGILGGGDGEETSETKDTSGNVTSTTTTKKKKDGMLNIFGNESFF